MRAEKNEMLFSRRRCYIFHGTGSGAILGSLLMLGKVLLNAEEREAGLFCGGRVLCCRLVASLLSCRKRPSKARRGPSWSGAIVAVARRVQYERLYSKSRERGTEVLEMVEFVDRQVDELKKLWRNKRQLAFQGLNLAMIVLSALMIWKSLMVVTKSESPVVVVLR